ncbi:hypothetical protein KM043_001998 [Ampulex compressa]|nr:hypothetical protein KM043_001998 [Ampulex compressa]
MARARRSGDYRAGRKTNKLALLVTRVGYGEGFSADGKVSFTQQSHPNAPSWRDSTIEKSYRIDGNLLTGFRSRAGAGRGRRIEDGIPGGPAMRYNVFHTSGYPPTPPNRYIMRN